MKEFIAKLGYVSCYAFGVPKQSLEDNLDGYFGIGMFWVAMLALSFLIAAVAVPTLLKKERKESK